MSTRWRKKPGVPTGPDGAPRLPSRMSCKSLASNCLINSLGHQPRADPRPWRVPPASRRSTLAASYPRDRRNADSGTSDIVPTWRGSAYGNQKESTGEFQAQYMLHLDTVRKPVIAILRETAIWAAFSILRSSSVARQYGKALRSSERPTRSIRRAQDDWDAAGSPVPAHFRVEFNSQRHRGEINCRTELIGTLPNEGAVTRPVGAIVPEQSGEWAVQRARYMTLEAIATMSDHFYVTLPAVAT